MNLLFIFIFGLITLAFIFPRSKILHVFLVFLSFSLFTLSFDEYDRYAYMTEYDNMRSTIGSEYEILFVALMKICNLLGFSFEGFRYVTAGITFSCLEYVVFKNTKNINIVWALYFIFSAMFDATLIRNSLAMGIAAIVIIKMMDLRTVKDYIVCISLAMSAALIHSAYWMLFVLLLLWFPLQKRKIKYLFVLAVLLIYGVVSTFDEKIFSIYSSLLVREATIDKYMTGFYSNEIGQIYNLAKYCFVISPVLFFWPSKMKEKRTLDGKVLLPHYIWSINLLFLVILLPQSLAANFSRLYRILIFFNYIYLAYCYDVKTIRPAIVVYGIIYSLVLLLLMLFFESITTIEFIFNMHLETNKFFNLFS